MDRADPLCPPDPQRSLTDRGIRRTRVAAAGIAAVGARPERILSSPYIRAVQTASIAAEAFDLPAGGVEITDALLPDADPRRLLRELRATGADELLCAGHAPHLDELIAAALGLAHPITAIKKAGAACLDLETTRLVWLHEPRTLRALGRAGDD